MLRLDPREGLTLSCYERGGTDELENPHIFQIAEVKKAGGLAALQAAGTPAALLRETKERMFAP